MCEYYRKLIEDNEPVSISFEDVSGEVLFRVTIESSKSSNIDNDKILNYLSSELELLVDKKKLIQ